MFNCCLCSDSTSCNANELEAHIASVHFDCTPYECEYCKYSKFPTEYAVRRHFEEDHGMLEYYVKFQVTPAIENKKSKIQECLERCLQPPAIHTTSAISSMLNASLRNKKEWVVQEGPCTSDYLQNVDIKPLVQLSDDDQNEMEVVGRQQSTTIASATTTALRNSCSSNSSVADLETSSNRTYLTSKIISVTESATNHQQDQDIEQQQNSLVVDRDMSLENDSEGMSISAHNSSTEVLQVHQTLAENLPGSATLLHLHQPFQSSTTTPLSEKPSSPIPSSSHRQLTVKFKRNSLHTITSCEVQEESKHPKFDKDIDLVDIQAPEHTLPSTSNFETDEMDLEKGDDLLSTLTSRVVECIVCKELVENKLSCLNRHVNTNHIKFALYKCQECGKEFYWTEKEALAHVQQMHPGKENCISDNWDKFYPRLNLRQPRFFNQGDEKCGLLVAGASLATANVFEHPKSEQNDALDFIDQNQMILSDFNQLLRGASFHMPGAAVEGFVDTSAIKRTSDSPCSGNVSRTCTSSAKGKKHVCTKCKQSITSLDWTLLNHVNSHLHLPLFECLGCGGRFEKYLRSYMVRHVKHHHGDNSDTQLIVDNRHKYKKQLTEGCLQLFPKD